MSSRPTSAFEDAVLPVSPALVRRLAAVVMGSEEEGRRWMERPAFSLGFAVPDEVAKDPQGAAEVHMALGRLHHGVAC